ncbi:MAG: DUF5688 family protein [Lachnospiraceae bacterium]
MNYKEFTKKLEASLKALPGIPQNITFTSTTRNNGVVTRSVCIRDVNSVIAPSIGLDYFYGEHEKGRSIDEIAEKIAEIYFTRPDFDNDKLKITWENVHSNIVYHLVNYDSNNTIMQKTPHIKILDLALIFKINTDYLGIDGYITINENIMSMLNVDISTLMKEAIRNTPRLSPLKFCPLDEEIISDGFPDDFTEDQAERIPLWLCTNKEKLYGASAIFYNEATLQIEERFLNDCYVIPSSVHEFLILKKSVGADIEYLEETVRQINNSPYVSETDYLSNTIYSYNELSEAYKTALDNYNKNTDS